MTPPGAAALTLVIPTRDRPERLAACLDAVAALDPAPGAVVVVDSASTVPGAVDAATAAGITVVRCDRPGASVARNAGWRASTTALVGFVDDDVRVAPDLVARWVEPFADPTVQFVTGAVREGDLVGGADGRDGAVAVTDDVTAGPITAERTGNVGASANLAARRSGLEAVGGFDELLGAGARFRAAEDIDLFDRLLGLGIGWHAPAAVGFHDQWRSRRELLRLELAYGTGFGVRLAKLVRGDRARAAQQVRYEAARLGRDVAHDLRNRYAFGVVSRLGWASTLLLGVARGATVRVADGHLRRRRG